MIEEYERAWKELDEVADASIKACEELIFDKYLEGSKDDKLVREKLRKLAEKDLTRDQCKLITLLLEKKSTKKLGELLNDEEGKIQKSGFILATNRSDAMEKISDLLNNL